LSSSKGHGRTFRRNEIANTGSASAGNLYRARDLVERFFNKIKQWRRITTRHDKLAANYLAFVKLASIRIWLRAKGVRGPSFRVMGSIGEAWMRSKFVEKIGFQIEPLHGLGRGVAPTFKLAPSHATTINNKKDKLDFAFGAARQSLTLSSGCAMVANHQGLRDPPP
jgi:hypothetical protein